MRRPLALVSAAVVLAAAALTGGAAQAAPPAPATERAVGTARTPATPEPEATPPAVQRAKPFRAVPPPAREPGAKAAPPDFGSGEKILRRTTGGSCPATTRCGTDWPRCAHRRRCRPTCGRPAPSATRSAT
ncbi:hypothetical protein [Micromonospora echinaurantiaca]|uniref:hypothetical protein n=1 Tax=Micromonospora echinaurantiaca TaxID=47857 RepID=UPI0037929722